MTMLSQSENRTGNISEIMRKTEGHYKMLEFLRTD